MERKGGGRRKNVEVIRFSSASDFKSHQSSVASNYAPCYRLVWALTAQGMLCYWVAAEGLPCSLCPRVEHSYCLRLADGQKQQLRRGVRFPQLHCELFEYQSCFIADHFVRNTPLQFPFSVVSSFVHFSRCKALGLIFAHWYPHSPVQNLQCRAETIWEYTRSISTLDCRQVFLSHLFALWGFEKTGSKEGAFYTALQFNGTWKVSFLLSGCDRNSYIVVGDNSVAVVWTHT